MPPLIFGRNKRIALFDTLIAQHTIPNPSAMTAALKKLSADNLSNLTPHPFFVFLHYSPPPLLQRMEAIEMPADTK